MRDIYIVEIKWRRESSGLLIGPIAGVTLTRKFCAVIRKRLRDNKHEFYSVRPHMLKGTAWFWSLDAVKDPTDRFLDSVFESESSLLDSL